MAFCVFIYRPNSEYDDSPDKRYQFPKRYLKAAQEAVGDLILYYESRRAGPDARGYFAVARVSDIIPDERAENMHLALIKDYMDFGNLVPFKDGDYVLEQGLLNADGKLTGRSRNAIRRISPVDFERILDRGLVKDDVVPEGESQVATEAMADLGVRPFEDIRERVPTISNRPRRDPNFRSAVVRAYNKRCAITGLSLINGGGRAEVQAAHIRPVEEDGPDIISNGIALTGTAHWMFDRGLVGLDADKGFEICVSRQANDPEAIQDMINETGKLLLPDRQAEHPRREFVQWHWENRFKH